MRLVWIALASLALFAAGGALAGQQQRPGGTVEGIVVETGTNQPLTKSSLELRSIESSANRYPSLSGDGGRFVFRNVPAGRYYLIASHNGYMRAEYRQRGPNGVGQPVTVASGAQLTGLVLSMTKSAAISGHVFGNNGLPAAYVQVQARRISYPGGQRTLTVTSSTVTDDLGAYRLYGLPAGQYVLTAQTNPPSLGIMPVLASATPPVPGTVMFQSASGPMQMDQDPANQNRRTNPNESQLSYFPGVADDREARVYDLPAGSDVAAIDAVTIAAKAVEVSGLVTGDIPPNATAQIMISPVGSTMTTRVSTQRGGAFTATLAPGSYIAVSTGRGAVGPARGGVGSIGYAAFDVRPGTAAPEIRINVAPSAQITGRFSVEGVSGTLPNLETLRILLTRNPPLATPNVSSTVTLTSRPDGTLTSTQSIIDGEYEIAVGSGIPAQPMRATGRGLVASDVVQRVNLDSGLPEGLRSLYVKSVRATNAEIVNGWLRMPTGAAVTLEIVLGVGGQLNGVARNAAGEAQDNVIVALVPEQQDRQSLYKNAVTDNDGRYRFEGIAPGNYRLFSWEDVQPDDWRNPLFIGAQQDPGKPIRIGEGARETADVTMVPARQ
jgi:5-hydroxyisourate hydrolase-like protein (transthyretin family)